jgi:two-component system, OmpR family, sensor histidine kinase MtrB
VADRTPKLRLQRRATVAFALMALASAVTVAGISYSRARTVLISQREKSALRQSFLNGRTVRAGLRERPLDYKNVLDSLATGKSSYPLILSGDRWYAASVTTTIGADDVPSALLKRTAANVVSVQRTVVKGRPYFVVGIPLKEQNIVYFEAYPFAELDRTLGTLAAALGTSAAIAAVIAAAVGVLVTRRVVRPLRDLAVAANRIAHGDLEARLDGSGDKSLTPLVTSFNDMASALQERVDRDTRFASNVSHELRSPLTAIRASLGLVTSRVDSMPERARSGVELLENQVDRFERMVLDLLDISKLDGSKVGLHTEAMDMVELVQVLAMSIIRASVPITVNSGPTVIYSDKRFLERVIANIIDNAQRHGRGLKRVTMDRVGDTLTIAFDDNGPGVPELDRRRIFERFARGAAARHGTGSGLGLALVAEYSALLGGRVTVSDAPGGGARFTLTLPEELQTS